MIERIVVRTSQGFDVIEGTRLTDKPVSRAEADRIARGAALPERKPPAAAASQPQPIDLRVARWESCGGSAGFTVR
jgi:hypothetical protein